MSIDVENKRQRIHDLVDSLPPDRLDTVESLLEQLRDEDRITIRDGKRFIRLGGLWKGVKIDEEDIAEVRREMWGRLGEDYE
jgi:hypothetical protein